jgi:DNA-binding NtrC family response regulator
MPDPMPIHLLVVDDQLSICRLCTSLGQSMGLMCFHAESAAEALEQLEHAAPEMVLTDLVLGDHSGIELLAEVKKRAPLTEVALMSAYGTVPNAVQAMRLGACDFLVKPFRVGELKLVLERMMEKVQNARAEAVRLRQRGTAQAALAAGLLCTDLEEMDRLTMQRVFNQVEGDKERAQKLLGISRATLYRKIKRYGIRTRQEVFARGQSG